MPKQLYKITQFHGGLNSNSDARDISESELSEATDVMVDEHGRIRLMGGTTAHAAPAVAVGIEPGYGLFQFSHDRINGHLGEHLDNLGDFSSNWSRTGDMAIDATDATYTHSTGAGTLIQTAANRLQKGVAAVTYAFTYTISNFTETITLFRILGSGSQFAAANTNLVQANGTHTTTFTSHASDPDQPFTIDVTSGSSGTFNIDNVSLVIYDAAETGDNYLVMADNESNDPAVYIYSEDQDLWSDSQVLTLGSTNNFAACFYYVDGALRVSDGNFGINNVNQWHGYIKETWFPDIGSGYSINQWYQTHQRVMPPSASYFQKDWVRTTGETTTSDIIPQGTSVSGDSAGAYAQETLANIKDVFSETDAVVRCVVNMFFLAFGSCTISVTVKVGFWKDDGGGGGAGTGVWNSYAQEEEILTNHALAGAAFAEHTFNYDAAVTQMDSTGTGGSGTEYWRIEVTSLTEHSGNLLGSTVLNSPVYEGTSTTFPELDEGGTAFTNGYSTGNNVCMLWAWDAAYTGATTAKWVPASNAGLWGIGTTFIYDGVQESQLTELIDESDNSTGGMSLIGLDGGDLVTSNRPAVVIAIADPTHDGAGAGDGTAWNKRITGCNIYMKDLYAAVESSAANAWMLQYSINFLTGKLRVESTQAEFDAILHSDPSNQSYYYWFLDTTHSVAPSEITSYEMKTGFDSTSEDYVSAYKTAVVANRMVYVGNIQVTKSNDTTEIMGDAMVKSSVARFDTFPISRLIEASVRDGDSIVKLEEYADRILQFKKDKMHIINVSQELEFLEDTFIHKGVHHSAAVCKTDFGIAWANDRGCYLYDGQKVSNLLEKQGRQIIKESEWASFLSGNFAPMVGYIPKKRQLIVVDDITTRKAGAIYLYDMVTQSWVKGAGYTFPDIAKTNFITDWDGNLVFAHTYGTVLEWADSLADATGDTSSSVDIKTKDIDFGQPGQVKRIYKFYITHRGSTSEIQTAYALDGEQGTFTETITGTELPASSAVTDWVTTEITPTAAPFSCKSIRLRLFSDGNTPANFEINDISIVFRLKGER